MIAQMFNPTAELVIPTGPQSNEANADIEMQLVTAERKHIFYESNTIKSRDSRLITLYFKYTVID